MADLSLFSLSWRLPQSLDGRFRRDDWAPESRVTHQPPKEQQEVPCVRGRYTSISAGVTRSRQHRMARAWQCRPSVGGILWVVEDT